jgi:hypothetical protein
VKRTLNVKISNLVRLEKVDLLPFHVPGPECYGPAVGNQTQVLVGSVRPMKLLCGYLGYVALLMLQS